MIYNTRGERVIGFLENFCITPDGAHLGKPLKLAEFQKKFILDVYDGGARVGILSIARKNGKSGLVAGLLLAHLVGPEAIANSQIVSGAQSRDQAALVFDLACKMINLSPKLQKIIRIIPSSKKLVGLLRNVEYKALSAEGKTAHGLSPVLAILDEVGQVQGQRDDFIDAITTSQGAHEKPLMLVISTQAANDNDLLSLWIDDAQKDAKTVCHVYSAEDDCDVLDEDAWQQANPALGLFRSLDDMRAAAEKASRMPSFENTFRNLYLNQRISANSPFINKTAWANCAGDLISMADCDAIWGGLDLSGRTDLTSLVLVGKKDNKFYVYPYFWTPEEGLHERAKTDRAPYDLWVKQGFITTTPGKSIDYEHVATAIAEITGSVPLASIAYDRWRISIIRKEFERLGVELPLIEWGQGFKDMSPALDAVENLFLNGNIIHNNNPVLNMCATNASITRDPAGNRKLDKSKTTGRIDGIVALAMGCGIAERESELMGSFDEFISNPLRF